MKNMTMPGFTAERSIKETDGRHRMAANFDSQTSSATVQPAVARLCEVLSELVWGAYNEGAYNRAEFWSNVMERGGCFR